MSLIRSSAQSAMSSAFEIPRSLAFHAWTVYLFMKADLKTAFIPVTCFAVASAPLASASHLLPTIFYILLHILQFEVSNQTVDPEEDARNKPHRPIPSKRLTLHTASILRWVLPVMCCGLSAWYSKEALFASFAHCVVTYVYNELGYASRARFWTVRNIMNALVYTTLEVAACLVAGRDAHSIDDLAWKSALCCLGIITTTIHAQDFPDIVGDAQIGRSTFPLAHPRISRPSILIFLLAWSVFLSSLWGLSTAMATAYIVLAAAVGARFILTKGSRADKKSYIFYNVWLALSFSLPAYYRFVVV